MIFQRGHVALILEGKKTATRRLCGRWRVGSSQPVATEFFQKPLAWVKILRKYRQPLGAMTEEDARKEGGYTLEEFRRVWEDLNGAWDPQLEVWVYEFALSFERGQNQAPNVEIGAKTSDFTHDVPFAQIDIGFSHEGDVPPNMWSKGKTECMVCGSSRVEGHYGISELAFFECAACGAVYNTAGELTHIALLDSLPDLES